MSGLFASHSGKAVGKGLAMNNLINANYSCRPK